MAVKPLVFLSLQNPCPPCWLSLSSVMLLASLSLEGPLLGFRDLVLAMQGVKPLPGRELCVSPVKVRKAVPECFSGALL